MTSLPDGARGDLSARKGTRGHRIRGSDAGSPGANEPVEAGYFQKDKSDDICRDLQVVSLQKESDCFPPSVKTLPEIIHSPQTRSLETWDQFFVELLTRANASHVPEGRFSGFIHLARCGSDIIS